MDGWVRPSHSFIDLGPTRFFPTGNSSWHRLPTVWRHLLSPCLNQLVISVWQEKKSLSQFLFFFLSLYISLSFPLFVWCSITLFAWTSAYTKGRNYWPILWLVDFVVPIGRQDYSKADIFISNFLHDSYLLLCFHFLFHPFSSLLSLSLSLSLLHTHTHTFSIFILPLKDPPSHFLHFLPTTSSFYSSFFGKFQTGFKNVFCLLSLSLSSLFHSHSLSHAQTQSLTHTCNIFSSLP